jgi:hypothetical protein
MLATGTDRTSRGQQAARVAADAKGVEKLQPATSASQVAVRERWEIP